MKELGSRRLVVVIAVVAAVVLCGRPGWSETINCTAITGVPVVITAPGIYCFTGDLATNMTTGSAIDIQSNNVVIDLNGHRLGGQAAGAGTQAYGIHANNRMNITVRNGTVRGFYTGVFFEGTSSSGHVVENLRLDFNKHLGINVQGNGHLIRDNQLVSNGGNTQATETWNQGIAASEGSGLTVMNNRVIDTQGFGNNSYVSVGIRVVYMTSFSVIGNLVMNTAFTEVTGIDIYGSKGVVSGNTIQNFDNGITVVPQATASAKCMNNLTMGTTTPFLNCTMVGDND